MPLKFITKVCVCTCFLGRGSIPDFLWFFFSFAVNTSVNVWFNKNKYLFLSTYRVCQAFSKSQGRSRDLEPRSSLECASGMCQPLQVTLAGDFSKRLQFHTCSVGMKALPDILHPLFFLKCLHSSTLLVRSSDAQGTPGLVNKKT